MRTPMTMLTMFASNLCVRSLRPRRSVRMAMQHEIMFYAIVQKEGLGLDKAVEEAKSRMSRYNVTVRFTPCVFPCICDILS